LSSSAFRLLNAATADVTREDAATDFRRFDRYPKELRWAIANNNIKVAAAAFQDHLAWALRNGYGAKRTIEKVAEIERNEIAVFAGEYRGRYKHELPFLAASVGIQRYGPSGPSRHPPKRYGNPVLRKPRRKRRL
jgi:hypothetical protein